MLENEPANIDNKLKPLVTQLNIFSSYINSTTFFLEEATLTT